MYGLVKSIDPVGRGYRLLWKGRAGPPGRWAKFRSSPSWGFCEFCCSLALFVFVHPAVSMVLYLPIKTFKKSSLAQGSDGNRKWWRTAVVRTLRQGQKVNKFKASLSYTQYLSESKYVCRVLGFTLGSLAYWSHDHGRADPCYQFLLFLKRSQQDHQGCCEHRGKLGVCPCSVKGKVGFTWKQLLSS